MVTGVYFNRLVHKKIYKKLQTEKNHSDKEVSHNSKYLRVVLRSYEYSYVKSSCSLLHVKRMAKKIDGRWS